MTSCSGAQCNNSLHTHLPCDRRSSSSSSPCSPASDPASSAPPSSRDRARPKGHCHRAERGEEAADDAWLLATCSAWVDGVRL